MKLTDYPTSIHNPFSIDSRMIRSFPDMKKVKGTDEYKKILNSGDREKHIRIFPGAYADFKALNSMAIDILGYIFKEVKEDVVMLKIGVLAKELGVSARTTIYRGIIDLLDKGFIGRKAGSDVYYINPAKIYPGSRVKWYNKQNGLEDEDDGIYF